MVVRVHGARHPSWAKPRNEMVRRTTSVVQSGGRRQGLQNTAFSWRSAGNMGILWSWVRNCKMAMSLGLGHFLDNA